MTVAPFLRTLFRMGPTEEEKAIESDHMLSNLSPEKEAALATYGKSEERIRMEQERDQKTS